MWVRQRIPGKLQAKAEGPLTFLRYVGSNHLGAEVMDSQGQVRQVAVANVLPYRGDRGVERHHRVWDLPVEPMSDDEGRGLEADEAVAVQVEPHGPRVAEWRANPLAGGPRMCADMAEDAYISKGRGDQSMSGLSSGWPS